MTLSFWSTIKEYFIDSFSLGGLFTLLMGIFIGFLLALLVYVIVLLSNIKKATKANKFNKEDLDEKDNQENEEKVRNYINASIARYDDVRIGLGLSEKIEETKDIIKTLVVDIAKIYYPKSKHPVAELSIDELIMLDRYVMDRIEKVFENKVLRIFKGTKVSTILYILDTKKKVEENKIVKEAKKLHLGGVSKVVVGIANALNPAYWGKKLITKTSTTVGTNKIIKVIIEIVGSETAKVYSKNVFIVDEEKIDEMINVSPEDYENDPDLINVEEIK